MLNTQTRTKAEIARENGARSHGPISPEGKARSSQNAATHSLSTSNVVCFTNEDRQRYDQHCQSYAACWKPENIMEMDLVEEMAAAKWQERRCQAIETAVMNLQIEKQNYGALKDDIANFTPAERTAIAFMELADHSKVLQLVLRYSSEHNRRYHRAMRQLIALRSKGVLASEIAQRNEPKTISTANKTNHQHAAAERPQAPPPPLSYPAIPAIGEKEVVAFAALEKMRQAA